MVHSGQYGAFLGDTQLASLSQEFNTVPGQYYWCSFWLDNPANGTGQHFLANWITDQTTDTVLNLLNPPALSWTNLQFLVRATGTNSTLDFEAENDPSYFGLDDVRVTPVPSPEFTAVEPSAKNLQLSWFAATGLVYQVQYKTNLLQAGWLNLNPTVAAANYLGAATDTNASGSAPARFYRLRVAP